MGPIGMQELLLIALMLLCPLSVAGGIVALVFYLVRRNNRNKGGPGPQP
jgi:hypothetical protein